VPARWTEVARIVDEALDLAAEQRAAFLDHACGADAELRREVDAILTGAEASNFLRDPAVVLAAPIFDSSDLADTLGTLVGPYRLVRELGHGGMGEVYLAERADGHFQQRVALKLIKRGLDSEEILGRFLAERQVLARLNHPHIARLLDGGVTAEGQPWFAMEYVEGVPLHRYCDDGRLDLEQRLAVFGKVCEAVQYAHRGLVVHRDLKPSNILVTATGEIKLLDFGIAKALTAEAEDVAVTRPEQRMMTPAYAAPEQLRGEPVTTATDVYALGAILYLLLTGQPAHQLAGCSRSERERIILEIEPEPPSIVVQGTDRAALRRRLAGDLDSIVLQALRKDPARRYPSVEALLDDLERRRTGLPVRARPGSVGYRTRKFIARHRLAMGSGALVFLALAAGLGGTLWQARATALEAAKARAVRDFVVGLFRVSQPEESRGREITARELLARGARRVDSELARQPELQGELLDVLGVIHRDLGLYAEADTLLRRSIELSRGRRGGSDREEAGRLTEWARVLAARGEYARAESLLVDARARLLSRHPADSAAAATLSALGALRRQQGRFAEAEALYHEALEIDRGARGGGPLRVAEDLDQLGLVLEEAGLLTAADTAYQQALALRRERLDADHPRTIESLHHLGALRGKQGEYADAERIQREVLERRRRVYPAGHPEIAYALQSLAGTLQIQGGYAEAEQLNLEALAILRQRLGPEHPETVELERNLATLLYEKGDLRQAESRFRAVWATWQRSLGSEHPTTLGAANDLAAVLKYQQRYGEAEPIYRETLASRRRLLGDAHPDVGESWGNLAELLYDAGRLPEAERAYRQTLAIYTASLPAGHVFISGSLLGLGAVLTDRGRPSEGEPLLREALRLRLDKFGPADRRTAKAQRALGMCLASLGRRQEAERLLLDSHRTLASATNWYHRTLRQQTARDLAALYQAWGRRDDAAAWERRTVGPYRLSAFPPSATYAVSSSGRPGTPDHSIFRAIPGPSGRTSITPPVRNATESVPQRVAPWARSASGPVPESVATQSAFGSAHGTTRANTGSPSRTPSVDSALARWAGGTGSATCDDFSARRDR
jgi:serine/threonine-protein kinase